MRLGTQAWPMLWPALLLSALALRPGLVQADTGHPRAPVVRAAAVAALAAEDANEARVIVKYRHSAALIATSPRRPLHAATMSRRLSVPLSDGRVLGERMQSLKGRGMNSTALAARLAAQPDVEWAVVDKRRRTAAAVPNDPYYADGQTSITPTAGQWYLRAPDSNLVSATNAIGAWARTTGSSSITVAVLDTGVVRSHPDLAGKLWAGYDFIARTSNSQDGDGRDADASDPGDWSTSSDSCGAEDSSWHGTQVAGLVAAASDNGVGVAGIGRNVMVLPVRVLGKCGGYDSDIIAGMRWAAGVSSDPVTNPNPARVINMSLGSSGSCDPQYRDAINELTAVGVSVVVAAGNDTGHAVNSPANCGGAIAVAGLRHAGSKVGYSNIGPQISIAAPAGNCVNVASGSPCLYPLLTTTNAGTNSPGAHIYSDSYNASLGTSFAAPLVAGTVALMLSVDSNLTPAQIKAHLQASARAFPTTGGSDSSVAACRAPDGSDQIECYCTASTCGAGMLDAGAAVTRVSNALGVPTAAIGAPSDMTAGQTIVLSGGNSSALSGRSIAGWQWAITSGSSLASLVGATNGSSVSLTATAAGAVTVRLTVTDNTGATHSTSTSINVQAASSAGTSTPTTGGSSGGGAFAGWSGLGWLLGLGFAVWALGRRPVRAS